MKRFLEILSWIAPSTGVCLWVWNRGENERLATFGALLWLVSAVLIFVEIAITNRRR